MNNKCNVFSAEEPQPEVYWQPAPGSSKCWADVDDDDDDDDYYSTTAPAQVAWGVEESQQSKESLPAVEESESEDELGVEYMEEEHEEEVMHIEPVADKVHVAPLPAKKRQLSKKKIEEPASNRQRLV